MEIEDQQYTYAEQQRIMRELEQHLKDAREQGDVAGVYYAEEALRQSQYE